MERMKIAILFGGKSPEHSVSLQSAFSVIQNLDNLLYEVVPIGITESGRWFRYYGEIQNIEIGTWAQDVVNCIPVILSPDCGTHGIHEFFSHGVETTRLEAVFPILHGENGEDGTIQGLIELSGIALVGCGTLASALSIDKKKANEITTWHGVPSPKYFVLSTASDFAEIRIIAEQLGYPLFVKPNGAGSSFGISKVDSAQSLKQATETAFQFGDELLLEEAVDGFEVGCAIMGNNELMIGMMDEIELSGGFFDFHEKYNLINSTIHLPARIDQTTEERVRQAAATVYKALGCSVFARVDLFLTRSGDILFNEVNTIPGFTAHSRFPNMMKGVGLGYSELLDQLIALGLENANTVTEKLSR